MYMCYRTGKELLLGRMFFRPERSQCLRLHSSRLSEQVAGGFFSCRRGSVGLVFQHMAVKVWGRTGQSTTGQKHYAEHDDENIKAVCISFHLCLP